METSARQAPGSGFQVVQWRHLADSNEGALYPKREAKTSTVGQEEGPVWAHGAFS